MNNNLLILGAGQYGAVTKEIAQEMGRFDRVDFLDDHNPIAVGKLCDYERLAADYSYAVVAIGNPEIRYTWLHRLEAACFRVAILVSGHAYVAPSAHLGNGTIVEPMAVVHANTEFGMGCIISAGAVVNHDCRIGDVCHINCNATVTARTQVPARTRVDCGRVVDQSSLETGEKK